MAAIPFSEWEKVGNLYQTGQPMRVVAEQYGVSIDAVTYVLRKTNIPRRTFVESNRLRYEASPASFTICHEPDKDLEAIGVMLYWAEGYKTSKACGIDFANSDPDMALLFLKFLRSRYVMSLKRLHFSLYHYSDQDLNQLISFWTKKLKVSRAQFKNHYCKEHPKESGRKMSFGVIHIRYNDKKMLRDVLNLIDSYKSRYASVG